MKNIRCYSCNKFGHVAKECGNKYMDHRRQYGNQLNKNIDIRKSEKDGSTNKQENKKQIRCGLALFSFEDEDEWYIDSGCSHHMTGYKNKRIWCLWHSPNLK